MDKKEAIKKISTLLAALEKELGGNIPDEYLIDGLCKELGYFDKDTMYEIIAEARKNNKGKSK